jgi:hypothetical protein
MVTALLIVAVTVAVIVELGLILMLREKIKDHEERLG